MPAPGLINLVLSGNIEGAIQKAIMSTITLPFDLLSNVTKGLIGQVLDGHSALNRANEEAKKRKEHPFIDGMQQTFNAMI